MNITLNDRTEETVRIYYKQSQQPVIKSMLSQKTQSEEEAISDYHKTLLPSASSYGRTIYADGKYIGDIWCYCIDRSESPNAMISSCIFDQTYWSQGIATKAVSLFLPEVIQRYEIDSVGAFVYSENEPSIRVFENNGFCLWKSSQKTEENQSI